MAWILIIILFLITIYQQYLIYKLSKQLTIINKIQNQYKEWFIQNIKNIKNNTDLIANIQNYIKILDKNVKSNSHSITILKKTKS